MRRQAERLPYNNAYLTQVLRLGKGTYASHQKSRARRRRDLSVARPHCAIRDALCSGQTDRPRERRRDRRQYFGARNDVSIVYFR